MTPKEDILLYGASASQTGTASAGPVMSRTARKLTKPTGKSIFKGIENFARPVKIDQKKIRMLLIDDNLDDAMKLRHIIRGITCWQIDFHWAETMKEAMINGQRHAYDFCMMDLAMARKNSTDVADLVGMISKNGRAVPFILLKNNGDRNTDIALGHSESANESIDCLEKTSLTPELLKHCIRYTIERSRRVKKLKDAKKYLKQLSSKLIDAQERERKIIGRELHDSIGSSLTAIRMALAAGKTNAGKTGTKKNSGASGEVPMKEILSMIDETIEETRRISEKLRPSMLDDLGLIKTIGWMQRKFQVLIPGIAIRMNIDVTETEIPEPLKIVIYRILQEALNNIAKHSNADTVDLTMKTTNGRLELLIHDNGNGFDPENVRSPKPASGGYGLEGMRDRIEFTKGDFEIISENGKGTTLRVIWPIPAESGL